jgi:hypothetical protein
VNCLMQKFVNFMARKQSTVIDSSPSPSSGRLLHWLGGILIPASLIIYGYLCVRSGHVSIFGKAGTAVVHQAAAFWMAIACLALAGFLHFKFHWAIKKRLRPFRRTLKIAALLIFVPSFCYSLYRTFDVI